MTAPLTPANGATLLTLARAAIAKPLRGDDSLERALASVDLTAAIAAPRAAFVTLKTHTDAGKERLRGCIGTMDTTTPLYRNVVETAPRAAGDDPRFPALTLPELDEVTIEVSALTALEPLTDIADIQLGRDGIQLDQGERRALFLPQVGSERDWTVEQFLDNLALKAGLDRGAWRESELRVFRVEAFREPSSRARRVT